MTAPGNAARHGFRRWRRTRPFWGGLLVLLAGVEILLIPLMNVVMLAAAGLMMSMGIGGVSGFLIGIVLTACGVLLWFDRAHRAFYGIIAVAGGVISFPATNFGGFFLGLLLAITGGGLALAWTPRAPAAAAARGGQPSGPGGPGEGLGLILGAPQAAAEAPPPAGPGAGEPGTAAQAHPAPRPAGKRPRRGTWRGRLAVGRGGGAALALLVAAAAAVPLLTARPALASARPTPASSQCLLGIICPSAPPPSPAPPGPSPSPGVLPVPIPLPSVPGGLLPGVRLPGSRTPAGRKPRKSPTAAAASGLVAYTTPGVLTAGAAHVTGFAYQGVADVPAAGGGTVRMMKFTATSFTAYNGIRGDMTQGGNTTTLTASSMSFTGGITIYATKFSGRLLGVMVSLTPGNAESVLLQLLRSATPRAPLTLTNVAADQPIISAGGFQGVFTMAAS